ncbi:MAG: hypothetical protein R3338_12035, partial [Thermoanaerobaculia bacterium]|nr:hypothetical protein [Thermoanaerobaculia bacterium]
MKRILVLLILLIVSAPLTVSGQPTVEDETDVLLRTLIEEIRALRQTLEKSRVYELRASMLLDQMRVRQSSVDRLRQRIIDLRQQISYDSSEELEQYVENVEQRLARETDPDQRRQLERELEMIEKRRELQQKRRS